MMVDFEEREVCEDWRSRPCPPDVWEFQNYRGWNSVIRSLVTDIITEKVRTAVLSDPPDYFVSDDLGWLDDVIEDVHGVTSNVGAVLVDRLRSHYRSFYMNGLLPLDPNRIHDEIRSRFLNGRFKNIGEAQLELAIAEIGEHETSLRSQKLFFEAGQDHLVDHCAHYMLHGSEYLHCLAIRLGLPESTARSHLRSEGRPTVFICDVPIELLKDSTLREFAGTALEYLFEEEMRPQDFQPGLHRGSGFSIHERLPAEAILGHFHPARMRDPHRGMILTDGNS